MGPARRQRMSAVARVHTQSLRLRVMSLFAADAAAAAMPPGDAVAAAADESALEACAATTAAVEADELETGALNARQAALCVVRGAGARARD